MLALILGSLAAYGLSRFRYKFAWMRNDDILFFFMSQLILPPVVLISWQPRVRQWLHSPELPRRAGYVAGGLIAVGFVVLASRPLWMVDHQNHNNDLAALQRKAGDTVDIARSYNEQTVHRLAQYYGWPVVVLGAIGYILLVRRCLRTRTLAPLAMITVGPSAGMIPLGRN